MPEVVQLERIAVVETEVKQHTSKIDKLEATLEKIEGDVSAIRIKMEKNISFIGGISFAFSLLGAGAAVILEPLLRRWSEH
jgi:hypothetical protein